MSTLQSRIQDLSNEFATGVFNLLRGVSLDELTGMAGAPSKHRLRAGAGDTIEIDDEEEVAAKPAKKTGKGGRLARRSEEDINKVVEEILAVVGDHPEGINAETLREELGIDKKELGKPMLVALENGQLRKEGQKRATVYFLGKGSKKASTKKTAVKASSKTKTKAVKAKPKKSKKAAAEKAMNGAAPEAPESSSSLEG